MTNLTTSENCFIADISGKDSIAALVKVIEENPSAVIIPSIIELACEYGDKTQYNKVIKKLSVEFNNKGRRIMPGIISEVNDLWKALVASNIQDSIKSYSFYSPCIACHLVLHLTRIKIAKHLNIKNVISGERELHSDREKINQLGFVLDFYNSIYDLMGIKHHLPLRHISNNEEVNKIIENHNNISIHLNCLFSGNYYKSGTNDFAIDKTHIRDYVEEYLSILIETFDKEIALNCIVIS
jgi:hypothetical protein